jgi:hypothetical protein
MPIRAIVVVILLCAAALPCLAARVRVPGLFNTGVDEFGFPAEGGYVDWHYGVVPFGIQSWVMYEPLEHWVPNSGTSKWVWQTPTGMPVTVNRTFRHTFDLSDFDPDTIVLTGRWATGGVGVDILINGVSTGQMSQGPALWAPFVISEGFVQGENTIDFVVQGYGQLAGLRVDALTAYSIAPTPPAKPFGGRHSFSPMRLTPHRWR